MQKTSIIGLRKLFRFLPSPKAPKLRTIKNALRFELHSRLCLGKADVAEKLRLELLRGFRDTSRIAFFRTFFSKKKVHKKPVFAESSLFDDTCAFCLATSFRHFLAKMPPPSSRQSLQGCFAPLANLPRRGMQIFFPPANNIIPPRGAHLFSSLLTQKSTLSGAFFIVRLSV